MLADRPSLSPLALVSATGLFTWPRVTDSQPHVWSLETDKASLHPPRSGLYRATVCARECVCVCVCSCVDNLWPKHSAPANIHCLQQVRSKQAVGVQPVSGPAVWSYADCRQAACACVFMCECIHSCKPLRTIPGIVTDGVIVTSQ